MEDMIMATTTEQGDQERGVLIARQKDFEFLKQWERLEDYPACPIGITLLRVFAEKHPSLYPELVSKNLAGHQSHPELARNPEWIAYRHHWGTCEDCMEV